MRSSGLALAAVLGVSLGSAALAADAPAIQVDARFVSFVDNGAGSTLHVKAGRKKLLFFLPPDGSGSGLEKLQRGDALTVSYRNTVEERIFRAMRGACPRKRPRRVFCVDGTLRKITNGDLGLYYSLERAGQSKEWLADFEPKGNVKEARDTGKKVSLFYKKEPMKTFVSFQRPDAGATGSGGGSPGAPASAP